MSTIHDSEPTTVAPLELGVAARAESPYAIGTEDEHGDDYHGHSDHLAEYDATGGGERDAAGPSVPRGFRFGGKTAAAAAFVGGVAATAAVGAVLFGQSSKPHVVDVPPISIAPAEQVVAPAVPSTAVAPASPPARSGNSPRHATGPAPKAPPAAPPAAVRPAPTAPVPAVRPAPVAPAPPPAADPSAPPKVHVGPDGLDVDGPNGKFSVGEGGVQIGGPGGKFSMGDDGIHISGPDGSDINIPLPPLGGHQ